MCACRFVSVVLFASPRSFVCSVFLFYDQNQLFLSQMRYSYFFLSSFFYFILSIQRLEFNLSQNVNNKQQNEKNFIRQCHIILSSCYGYIFQEIKLNIVRYVYVMLIYALRHWFCHITHRANMEIDALNQAQNIFHFEILNLFIFSGSFAFSTV